MKYKKIHIFIISGLVLAAGLLVTFLTWKTAKDKIHEIDQQRYIYDSENLKKNIQQEIDGAIANLVALTAFFNASETVNITEFSTFVKPILEFDKNIQALEWIPQVKYKHRLLYERNIRSLGYPVFIFSEKNVNGQLIPALKRNIYYPVAYVEPYSSNKTAHGFDLYSNDARKASLDISRDTGKLVATSKIKLVQELGNSYGFLAFSPVYNKTKPLKNAFQREQALMGFVLGVFRINTLIENAIERMDASHIRFELYDVSSEQKDLLFDSYPIASTAIPTEFKYKKNLLLPLRKWELVVTPTIASLKASIKSEKLTWFFLEGTGISVLLSASVFLLLLSRQQTRITKSLNKQLDITNQTLESTVRHRTHELEQTNINLRSHIEELTIHRKVSLSLIQDAHISQEKAEKKSIELERSNRDLDEFAYVASHDLKSPLRGIDQIASWIAEDLAEGRTEDTDENLSLMRNRIQRMEQLLTDLLAYSQVGRKKAINHTVDVKLLLQDVFNLLSPPDSFQLKLNGSFPKFNTLVTPFEQVLRNLLNNAVKHHDRDDGVINISCKNIDNYYEFIISDDGPGIAPEHHQLIFKMFKSLKPRDEVEGSGMGLAIIKKITETYNGGIRLTSKVSLGSTFYFTWPKNINSPN